MQLLDASRLLQMSHHELDDLYRNSPAGEIPRGEGHGTVLVAPGTELAEAAAQFVHRLGGKVRSSIPIAASSAMKSARSEPKRSSPRSIRA